MERLKVFLPCTGLGRVRRGFESFTEELFDALHEREEVDARLFSGGPLKGKPHTFIRNYNRFSEPAIRISRIARKTPYAVECLTFAAGLKRHLLRERPEVMLLSDYLVGRILRRLKVLEKAGTKFIFSNGGPSNPPFPAADHVHQINPGLYEVGLRGGIPPERQTMIPYGFAIEPPERWHPVANRQANKRSLGLPEDRPIVLSVGQISKGHKRMDYVIRELAACGSDLPFLVMLGQESDETPQVRALAEELLPGRYLIKSVARPEVEAHYRAADLFVLGSLGEGFGRVYIEAAAAGLPVLANRFDVTEMLFPGSPLLADFEQPGALAELFRATLQSPPDQEFIVETRNRLYDGFSWDVLTPAYIEMMRKVAAKSSSI